MVESEAREVELEGVSFFEGDRRFCIHMDSRSRSPAKHSPRSSKPRTDSRRRQSSARRWTSWSSGWTKGTCWTDGARSRSEVACTVSCWRLFSGDVQIDDCTPRSCKVSASLCVSTCFMVSHIYTYMYVFIGAAVESCIDCSTHAYVFSIYYHGRTRWKYFTGRSEFSY